MEARNNIFEDSFERVQSGFRSAGEEMQKLQDRVSENRREFSERFSLVAMTAFGSGFTWACALIRW